MKLIQVPHGNRMIASRYLEEHSIRYRGEHAAKIADTTGLLRDAQLFMSMLPY